METIFLIVTTVRETDCIDRVVACTIALEGNANAACVCVCVCVWLCRRCEMDYCCVCSCMSSSFFSFFFCCVSLLAAMKVAGHELKGLISYFNLNMKDLHFPIMSLVDYLVGVSVRRALACKLSLDRVPLASACVIYSWWLAVCDCSV
jgi:Clustered mitochondria